jgi:dTDP-L-rhamnose 4-epimerase
MSLVLVTGGAGFVGSNLTKFLVDKGFRVRVLDNLVPQIHGNLPQGLDWLRVDERVEYHRASILDHKTLSASLADVQHVVHLAAETGTGQSMYEIARYIEINSLGTAMILEAIANQSNSMIKSIVLASSRSVYGEGAYVCYNCDVGTRRIFPESRQVGRLLQREWEPECTKCGSSLTSVPTQESDPVNPRSIYAASKKVQEDLVRIFCESTGIGYSILRLQNVYGESQSLSNPYTGILSIFFNRARQQLYLPVFEDGLESRDFVHVDDVIRVIFECLSKDSPVNAVLNVGSGNATTILSIAEHLIRMAGSSSKIEITSEFRLGDIRHNTADLSKITEVLGYTPKVSFDEGIKRFVDWATGEPPHTNLLDSANFELRNRKLLLLAS